MKQIYLIIASAVALLSAISAQAAPVREMHRAADDSEWRSLGKGTFVDGWVTPGINAPADYTDPTPYAFEVEVMESTTTPGIYKMVSPYTSEAFPFLSRNTNTTPCDIIIDATNPDFVQVEPQNSGFVCDKLTPNMTDPFYISVQGTYYYMEGNDIPDIISYGYASTLKDGVITFHRPCFGRGPSTSQQGYNWQGNYDGSLTLPAKSEDSEWRSLGKGTFVDGWVTPGINAPADYTDPTPYAFEVEVMESTATPGIYKMVSPYTSEAFPFLSRNTNTTPCDIIIDATNPDFVQVEPQNSGFVCDKLTSNMTDPFYISVQGTYYYMEGNDIPDIISYGYASTLKDGVITFHRPCFGRGPSYSQQGYLWQGGYDGSLTLPAQTPSPGGWVSLGNATFTDGFILPGWNENYSNMSWPVEIQEKEDQPGLYRLINPYTVEACPLLKDNFTKDGNTFILIDATDPDAVLIAPQRSGFNGYAQGVAKDYYIGNLTGYLNAVENWSVTDLKQYLPQRLDKMADGIITITHPEFGFNANTDFGYNWTDIECTAVIALPGAAGIADIEAEATEAEAEYFNLQGIRIAQPQPGVPCIRRTGAKVEKIFIR